MNELPKDINLISLVTRLLVSVVFLAMHSITHALPIEPAALQKYLTQSVSSPVADINNPDLQQFYSARHYQPVWLTPQSSALDMALAFIATAESEGLNSRDYQLVLLQKLRHQTDQTLHSRLELELRTTHAVLALIRDLARGRFVASIADPDWHIPQPAFDAVAFLLEAVNSDRLQQSLTDLPPKKPSYQSLKQTLIRYQKYADRQFAWTPTPDTPLIRPDTTHSAIPLIRQRITQAYAIDGIAEYNIPRNKSSHYDAELVTAIKAFQTQHGLNPDGIIGDNTRKALNTPLDWKIRQLRINMERLRWLPRNLGKRYLLVNTAGFRLTAAEQGEHALSMKIIVGRDYRSTPSFSSRISHIILNPYWNVPASIARKDLLPKQKKDPQFFTRSHIKIYSNHRYDSGAINPDTIDWHAITNGFPYVLRQEPGIDNALGQIKFIFPNPFNIYLHDTPSKALFQKDVRTFSSGCIRLEKPLDLATFSLNNQDISDKLSDGIESGKTTTINLPEQLPIYMVYITTWVDNQEKVHFSPDIYDRDQRALHYAGW
ncbi:MAG: L,D-transpeptidase family protein [Pseudomonadota bacterium]